MGSSSVDVFSLSVNPLGSPAPSLSEVPSLAFAVSSTTSSVSVVPPVPVEAPAPLEFAVSSTTSSVSVVPPVPVEAPAPLAFAVSSTTFPVYAVPPVPPDATGAT